jgi:Protein ChrB, N-terminal
MLCAMQGQAQGQGRWLLLIYRVPQEPAGRRTYVWRQLRQLGAIYLQQAAAILPDLPGRPSPVRAVLEALAERIREFEGEASLLETASPTADWERDLIARFNQARDAEYAEVVENVERFEDEVKRETRKKKFTFAELEDADADWEKIARLQQRIVDRDFFNAAGRAATETAIERGRRVLETFTEAVYQLEGVSGGNGVEAEPLIRKRPQVAGRPRRTPPPRSQP